MIDVARLRLANQRLVGKPFGSPGDAVRWLGAVQAQDYHGAKWALALRTRGFDSAAMDEAFSAGAMLRTHIMRPTWHFVAPQDIRWMLALTRERVHAANAHMYRTLELTPQLRRRANAVIAATLEGQSATRTELATALEKRRIPARSQRLAYLMMNAELEGLVCSGPLKGKQHTYALLDERVPPAATLDRPAALARLAAQYFRSHGPAMTRDFAWWSGLTMASAKEAVALISSDLEAVTMDDNQYWMAAGSDVAARGTVLHLLPNYDEHVVAYRNHGPSLDPAVADAMRGRTDRPLDVHLIARNGLIVGGWKRTIERESAVMHMTLLARLVPREHAALRTAAQAYGAFLGVPVAVTIN